jgi:hypothetical protein
MEGFPMSRSIVRRLTVAIVTVAVLGLALPASAATARQHAAKAPAVSGSSLVDQFLVWVGSFWSVQPAEAHGQTKSLLSPPLTSGTNSLPPLANADRGGMIDPNGGS